MTEERMQLATIETIHDAVKEALLWGRSWSDYWTHFTSPEQRSLFAGKPDFEQRCERAYQLRIA